MSDKTFALEILTPERTLFKGKVTSLVAPAALGYLGVLANHAPLVTTLTPGKIVCREADGRSKIFQSTGSGFLEARHNQVMLLLDETRGVRPHGV